ncbi:response regulator [Paludibacterium yongneupense]|uniref:response regulator n=1 Tax=Paludibacterium yongneupense TaxID=400061 RepID=UPI00041A7672|nr:response regulator [Paludibacterium yongneupense]
MRILVVDDDPFAAEMVAAVLEDGGCDAIVVDGAGPAQTVLNADKDFDAIVSDMNMPGQSGMELFRALRAQGSSVPFILLSADDPDVLAQREPRLDACIAKDADLETSLMVTLADVLLPPAD